MCKNQFKPMFQTFSKSRKRRNFYWWSNGWLQFIWFNFSLIKSTSWVITQVPLMVYYILMLTAKFWSVTQSQDCCIQLAYSCLFTLLKCDTRTSPDGSICQSRLYTTLYHCLCPRYQYCASSKRCFLWIISKMNHPNTLFFVSLEDWFSYTNKNC